MLAHRGRLDEAGHQFRRAVEGRASDSLTARLNLLLLRQRRGDIAAAMQGFDDFIDIYNRRRDLSSEEITAVATAVRQLGAHNPQLFQDALRAYDEAIAADRDNLDAQILVGDLFLEKYQGTEAREAFEAILARAPNHPRALLGLARTRRFAGSSEAMDHVNQALDVNPNLVPARVFRASLYAEAEQYEEAAREVERALEVDPGALDALALLAAVRYLQGDRSAYETIRQRLLALNPRFAGLYVVLAEVSARNRLYHEAVRFAQEGVALDSSSWRAFALLGINQLRVGQMDRGRANLERAFSGDPFDLWTKNTLDLLDTLVRYDELETPRFRMSIDRKESALLALYMNDLAEEAYDRLAGRYEYRPDPPVRIEVYPSHADFSVRSVGLVGLGALGVSFGPVIAMDSPSARERGAFNWGSTLWHEIAHTFHLGLSAGRVPRWFTEGLAVFEERRARPGWGDGVDPGFLIAYRDEKLLPVSRLNDGFTRPAYPEQLGYSYYQASLVCELIERDHGTAALTRMLRAYRDGRGTGTVFRSVLGIGLDAFDDAFDRYVRERFARPLDALKAAAPIGEGHAGGGPTPEGLSRRAADPTDFVAQLAMGQLLVEQGDPRGAIPYLERAKALFPEYAGPSSPYWHLARAFSAMGDTARAVGELRVLTGMNGGHLEALLALADHLESLGDASGAVEALDKAMYVYPLDFAVHRRLAELCTELGDWPCAVRERHAVVALDPVDRAEALFRLAHTYFGARDLDRARTWVLRALEIAPNFTDAQDLLLEIHDARQPR
jgi:tetratricopeptide (TPR) repeat protein